MLWKMRNGEKESSNIFALILGMYFYLYNPENEKKEKPAAAKFSSFPSSLQRSRRIINMEGNRFKLLKKECRAE